MRKPRHPLPASRHRLALASCGVIAALSLSGCSDGTDAEDRPGVTGTDEAEIDQPAATPEKAQPAKQRERAGADHRDLGDRPQEEPRRAAPGSDADRDRGTREKDGQDRHGPPGGGDQEVSAEERRAIEEAPAGDADSQDAPRPSSADTGD